MANIIVVPDWLEELLSTQHLPLSSLKSDLSTIVSPVDLINYHKAQMAFMRFLASDCQVKDRHGTPLTQHLMYRQLFMHDIPNAETTAGLTLHSFFRQNETAAIDWSLLVGGAAHPSDVMFNIVPDEQGLATYIIGKRVGGPVSGHSHYHGPSREMMLSSLLNLRHSGLRIEHRITDKSSVFRDSPLLTSLYVGSLC